MPEAQEQPHIISHNRDKGQASPSKGMVVVISLMVHIILIFELLNAQKTHITIFIGCLR